MQFGIGFVLFVLTLPVLANLFLKDYLGMSGWLVFTLTVVAIMSLIAGFRHSLSHSKMTPHKPQRHS